LKKPKQLIRRSPEQATNGLTDKGAKKRKLKSLALLCELCELCAFA